MNTAYLGVAIFIHGALGLLGLMGWTGRKFPWHWLMVWAAAVLCGAWLAFNGGRI